MSDIVERLRKRVDVAEQESRFGDAEDCREAADEIERLRAERDKLFNTNGELANTIGADNLRLRAALEEVAIAAENNELLVPDMVAKFCRKALAGSTATRGSEVMSETATTDEPTGA